ncbi:vacuolar ATP synthase subunit s1 (ATP6S1) domain-containing protein [Rhizoctonia solani AG-1 IA]|uniref:Vacuolar ATP synthase subunit s1 (ATP6S1) domain-containing protein n=1 Tax=Thanatephorus cucumeris (strain AG1-IA) TaxID=983506 RepID=L8WU06_THACA|nr:vacuolar ATP synthase subunit s1 (ATP6S1) domain-containing protein [Rhizoctonia solani AG-1 IA]
MFKSSVVASAVLLSGFANAFYDSVPFLAWSNHPSLVIDALMEQNPTVPSHAQILNSLMSTDELCSLDAMIVIGQPGVTPAKVHFPYIPVSSVPETDVVARDVAALCGFAADEWSLGSSYHGTSKRVIYFDLPESTEKFWSSDDETLEQNLDQIISQFNSYAIFLSGTSSLVSTLVTKRQQPNSLSRPNFVNQPHTITTFANATLPTGGILARYQLLTPGLLTALIIAFGLLIPLLMVGINALAGIQSPLRTESPKGPSLEKKNQ